MKSKSPIMNAVSAAASLLLFTSAGAEATMTLLLGNPTTQATNWANGTGAGGSTLVWGILVDTSGNGFVKMNAFSNPFVGVSFADPAVLQAVQDPLTGLASDDRVFLSPALMGLTINTNDGAILGQNRITVLANVPLASGVSTGDAFAIVWFNRTALTGTGQAGEKYGVFTNPLFVIPEEGSSLNLTAVFAGPDPLKLMVPEPSALMLSAVGALGLMRRRRRSSKF